MWFEFYSLPKNQGICCEHCGTYIRNVCVIHFSDGFTLKCGLDCFNKLLKQSNLSEYGAKALKRSLKSLKLYDEMRVNWTRWQTPEEAEADGCSQRIEDPENRGTWRIRTQVEFEEEKAWILTDFIPYRIKSKQAEIEKRFKNARVPRE